MRVWLTIGWIALLASNSLSAGGRIQPPLHPQHYRSPSLAWNLFVDPSDFYGRGPSRCQLAHAGTVVWALEKPYTLFEAAVADDGSVAGYAYEHGEEGFPRDRSRRDDHPGVFRVVILDPSGKERLDATTPRVESRFLHDVPQPQGTGVFIEPETNSAVIRVRDPDINTLEECWWRYRLSTGALLPRIEHVGRTEWEKKETDAGPAQAEPALLDPPPPELNLRPLGDFFLGGERPDPPTVRGVTLFDFDGMGRIGFVRAVPDEPRAFVVVEPSGNLVRETPLPASPFSEQRATAGAAWIAGDRWLVWASFRKVEARSRVFWLDVKSAELKPTVDIDCPFIEGVDGFQDGGFVALVNHQFQFTSENELRAFDSGGRFRWSVRKDPTDPNAQYFRNSVAVSSRGEVLVLGTVRHDVHVFSPDGKFLRVHKLDETPGRSLHYPVGISADSDAGFLLEDFNGTPRILRFDIEAKLRGDAAPPRTPDGRAIDVRRFRAAPDGRIWGSDGSSLMRLDGAGLVDQTIGQAPAADTLGAIEAATLGPGDALYAVDRRTAAVHVFDSNGKPVRILRPDPQDVALAARNLWLSVRGDGSVLLGGEGFRHAGKSGTGHVQFSPSGERIGVTTFDLDSIFEHAYAQPTGARAWVVAYQAVCLVDADGKAIRTVARRHDEKWIESTGPCCVAPDGSIAFVTEPGFETGRNGASTLPTLEIYSASGDLLRGIPFPHAEDIQSVAHDGRLVALITNLGVFALNSAGQTIGRLHGEVEGDKLGRYCFIARGGRELWFLHELDLRVRRYAAP